MLEYGDKIYYIDLDQLDRILDLKPVDDDTNTPETETTTTITDSEGNTSTEVTQNFVGKRREMNVTRFNTFNTLLDILRDDIEEEDEGDSLLGGDMKLDKASFAVKLAFNTLKLNKIIKEK